ncbi:MAG: tRNA (N(6)-L-threonylcarbamoyladenosine(37)-C(2))-methylthiotransferase MtaB [Holosporales bacterium]|jgi:threonylcarbamoyladenosine tRNA methylthiotransferase MtaB|nr:tRNA (N(6)-L-threonylcarbamoyladenosine(37)-C(2))-methylthiotransferase MtaB [Holosporales bacterium]
MATVKVITLGCRFNFYESEIMKSKIASHCSDNEFVVVNTCSVTHEAERQSRQAVRKVIKENKSAKIIVTGCAAKTSQRYFEDLDGIFKVLQNNGKNDITEHIDLLDQKCAKYGENAFIETNSPLFFTGKARAFLQIQNGCDNFCTYCVVPFTRGRSKSLPVDIVLKNISQFVTSGFDEIVLSGIDIASYGRDLGEDINLCSIIKKILKNSPVRRLRISSIDPSGINDELLGLLVSENRVMPHLHLSIQSGDNSVLRVMRRKYNREKIIEVCNRILEQRSDVVFGADLIAGFPAETDNMFANTLKLVDEANLSLLHVFPYSPRSRTIAANMVQIPREVILERAKVLRQKTKEAKLKLFQHLLNKTTFGVIEKLKNEYIYGKTHSFLPFKIHNPPNEIVKNNVYHIKIVGFDEGTFIAELI